MKIILVEVYDRCKNKVNLLIMIKNILKQSQLKIGTFTIACMILNTNKCEGIKNPVPNAYVKYRMECVGKHLEPHIKELVEEYPDYEKYDLLNNSGYGTQNHIDAIKMYGITPFHRKSFGICKNYI